MRSLYRRYRPLKLADVVGQPQVTEVLGKALGQGKISHAYLFIGPRGCGKTSVARIFAHEVNGFPYAVEDDYVDIVEIDGASNRGIDNIRELREKAAIAPTAGKYKIYIIDEVHMLTKEAFNALLKTLEEPPEHVIFIMATTDAHKVPVTITSRAQTYTFRLADAATMTKFLGEVCEREGIKITGEALELIAKRGGGSFRDSLSLLDQISTLSDGEISYEMVVSALGLPDVVKITTLLDECASGDVVKITTLVKDLLSSGVKPETMAEEMIAAIIETPKPELLPLLSKLTDVKAPFAEARLLVALLEGSDSTSFGNGLESEKRHTLASGRNIRFSDSNQNMLPKPVEPAPASFDWQGLLEKVKNLNEVVYTYLNKSAYEVRGGVLMIYPKLKIAKNILSKDNNKRIIVDAAGMKVEIGEVGEKPENAPKDATLDQISAIMGGEVNDGGINPFE